MPEEMIVSNYIYIPVSDMEKSATWYEKMLGFKTVIKDSLYYDLRTNNGIRIMLLPNETHIKSQMNFNSGQQAAYGFVVKDINKIRDEFIRRNVKVGELFDYCGKSFSFYDLDENKIELWQELEK